MQPVEITLRYIVAAGTFALAIVAFHFYGLHGAWPATLAAVLMLPPIDALLERWSPELTGMTGPASNPGEVQLASEPGRGDQGLWRTAATLLLTTLRVVLCGAGFLYTLYLLQHGGDRAALHLAPVPTIEYRDRVTLDGNLSGAAVSSRALRLSCNGQPVAIAAGRFITQQPLQLGVNSFHMVLDILDGKTNPAQTHRVEQTVTVRRVSEEQYDEESFGRGDCAQSGIWVRRSGAWGPGWPASRFAGTAELRAPRLQGRCVQELTASRLPVKEEAAALEVQATVGHGQIKVLLRHPDGALQRFLVTPDKPLHYSGAAQITRMSNPVTQAGDPAEGTPPATSMEEFWVAYLSLEPVADPASGESADALDVALDARYLLK